MTANPSIDDFVRRLLPSISSSLNEQFNVFRVMHHGTHEKQLSNVFAWLLRAEGSHQLGDTFQRLFVEGVNRALSPNTQPFVTSGYRVEQEVDTFGREEASKDIADIVLSSTQATIVIENFESSDGHGHDYHRYRAHGSAGGKQSVVVLLCARSEPFRLKDCWEHAIVLTYTDLLEPLREHVDRNPAWRQENPEQDFFLRQLVHHFLESYRSMNDADRIDFIKTMCDSGESERYGNRPQESAGRRFAELVAEHAERQFHEGRDTLAQLKQALKQLAVNSLQEQVNCALGGGSITSVEARFVGKWEWCITFKREAPERHLFLEFGPTAVAENGRAPTPIACPDYGQVFVTRGASPDENVPGIDYIAHTGVRLEEVLVGLAADDARLCEALVAAARAD